MPAKLRDVTVADAFSSLLSLAVLAFSVTSMLSVGFSYTLREIAEPLRDVRGALLALAANFVLVPLLAYGVSALLSPGEPAGAEQELIGVSDSPAR